ncbi:MAG: M6 family metalloprotease domain-containing protein [Ideonella sp.]|nr:M6 family metalloprotease domain-containing protein [Ideonella sp.]MCC7458518.1 M6 family metalloprotease domain-containing protein [Nitrospira sp.]
MATRTPHHADGPTTCRPTAAVLRDIQRAVRKSHVLSPADLRLAAYMGLVAADGQRPLGFNDGVFYPPSALPLASAPANRPLRAARMARATKPRKRRLHALALLVDFADNPGRRPAAEFQRMLFDPDNADSMTRLYRDMSYGLLELTGEVIGYLRAPNPYAHYTAGESGTGNDYPHNTPGLLFDALTAFCKTDNLARFDSDGDGFVDGIFLIHAGGGAEAEPDPNRRKHMIWSHKWTLPRAFENRGVKVFAYSTEPEDGRVGVFAHEFGHVLGLPDLYDTSYRSEGVGNWCLMGGGSWGGGGSKPTRLSCWCLAKLGWIKPLLAKSAPYTLDTLERDAGACLRVWIGGKASGPEYFLLENKQATGRDRSLPGSGLAVWHIDEARSDNTNPLAYKVGLMQADGRRDLELARNAGDRGDVYPGSARKKTFNDKTKPSSRAHDGSSTGVALSAISVASRKVKVTVKR